MSVDEIRSYIDLSALSDQEQAEFIVWFAQQTVLHPSLSNALRKGQFLQAALIRRSVRREPEFTVRISQ